MKQEKDYEIILRGDGYWLIDHGVTLYQGPFDSIESAEKEVPEGEQLQYPLEIK